MSLREIQNLYDILSFTMTVPLLLFLYSSYCLWISPLPKIQSPWRETPILLPSLPLCLCPILHPSTQPNSTCCRRQQRRHVCVPCTEHQSWNGWLGLSHLTTLFICKETKPGRRSILKCDTMGLSQMTYFSQKPVFTLVSISMETMFMPTALSFKTGSHISFPRMQLLPPTHMPNHQIKYHWDWHIYTNMYKMDN